MYYFICIKLKTGQTNIYAIKYFKYHFKNTNIHILYLGPMSTSKKIS